MNASDLYPPPPAVVPEDLTRPTPAYRRRVALTFASILVFLAVYAALIGGAAFLIDYSLERSSQRSGHFWGVVVGALLLLFFVKVLFKRQRLDRSTFLEVTRADEPRLFAFIDRLVEETGAPAPKRVYLTSEVNAAVFYDSSFLSLFFPVRKNLLIGLGVVNALGLSELKAVFAHELGHFSQRSMRLGSYVYVANRVIADMIWSRDRWDELVSVIGRLDIRIAWVGWLVAAVTWVLRQFLGLLFRVINLAHAALSRQMEFAADRMAVRTTGSDALCHALLKLRLADACMTQTLRDLAAARDHGLHTDDLFFHQSRAVDIVRHRAKDPSFGVPPPLPDDPTLTTRVFPADDTATPSMWASHPPAAEREANAKATYLRAPLDDRSAWLLFSNPDALRRAVTRRHFEAAHGGESLTLTPAQDVHRFIEGERADTMHDPRYRGIYESRVLYLADLDGALAELASQPSANDVLAKRLEALYGEAFAAEAARREALLAERDELVRQVSGEATPRAVRFRGESHPPEHLEQLFEQLGRDLDETEAWLKRHDRELVELHLRLAASLGDPALLTELDQRLRFQAAAQKLLEDITKAWTSANQALASIEGELDEEQSERLMSTLNGARDALGQVLEAAAAIHIPALANVDPGPLAPFLLREPLVDSARHLGRPTPEWLQSLLEQLQQVGARLDRLTDKGLGAILRLNDAIATEWRDQPPPARAQQAEALASA